MVEGMNELTVPDSIGTNLIRSFKDTIDNGDGEALERLFPELDRMAQLSTEALENARKLQALSLWLVETAWDKLPYSITLNWEDYMDWAKKRTGLHPTTIANYVRAARVFYDPSLKLPERVSLHDGDGEPVTGERGDFQSVEPDVLSVPISKLILTAKAFEDGELTEKELGQLFNRKVPWNALAETIRDKRLSDSGAPITRFFLRGHLLAIVEDGVEECFGELYVHDDDPLVRKGCRQILLAAGIVSP